jgi:hypothetical protein
MPLASEGAKILLATAAGAVSDQFSGALPLGETSPLTSPQTHPKVGYYAMTKQTYHWKEKENLMRAWLFEALCLRENAISPTITSSMPSSRAWPYCGA